MANAPVDDHPEEPGDPHAARHARREAFRKAAIEAELETGRREPTIHAAKRSLLVRIGSMFLGTFLILAGLVMMVTPGPGLVALALGLGVLAPDVPFAARLLDRVKARLPQDEDGDLPTHVIVTMVVTTVAFTAGSIWFAWFR